MPYTKILKCQPFVNIGATYCMDKPISFTYNTADLLNVGDYVNRGVGVECIDGLRLYLKSDAGISSGLGNAIPLWEDRSGYGNDGSQTTSANRPVLTADVQNGLPMVLFDGTNDELKINGITSVVSGNQIPFTLFMVVKNFELSEDHAKTVWGFSSTGNASMNFTLVPFDDVLKIERGNDAGNSYHFVQEAYVTDSLAKVIIIVYTGTIISLYINGVLFFSGGMDDSPFTVDKFSLGRSPISTFDEYDGYVGDIGLYNRALTNDEITSLDTALKSRWGI
jgi:hypothetical protein